MQILHATLTRRWFDNIASGFKKEEYREIKPHWIKRFIEGGVLESPEKPYPKFKEYTHILFSNGYGDHRPKMLIELKRIYIGFGKPAWGADGVNKVFILKLGDIVEFKNYTLPEDPWHVWLVDGVFYVAAKLEEAIEYHCHDWGSDRDDIQWDETHCDFSDYYEDIEADEPSHVMHQIASKKIEGGEEMPFEIAREL